MNPYFSILIPVCNQVGKMDDCIASLKNQTFGDYEVIFVDDGSTDASYEMLCGFAAADSRYQVRRHEKNGSLVAARTTAMRHASGEYIIFLDSDDSLTENACEELHTALEASPVDLLYFGLRREPSGEVMPPEKTDDLLLAILEGRVAPAAWKNCYSSAAVKKALERITPFYCNMGEDTFFSAVLNVCADSFGTLDKVIYLYNAGGMSSCNSTVQPEKIRKGLASVKASGEETVKFIDRYAPKYASAARAAAERMIKYILWQYTISEENWCNVFEVFSIFNTEEYREIFNWGCENIFRTKILRAEGRKVKVGFDFSIEEET